MTAAGYLRLLARRAHDREPLGGRLGDRDDHLGGDRSDGSRARPRAAGRARATRRSVALAATGCRPGTRRRACPASPGARGRGFAPTSRPRRSARARAPSRPRVSSPLDPEPEERAGSRRRAASRRSRRAGTPRAGSRHDPRRSTMMTQREERRDAAGQRDDELVRRRRVAPDAPVDAAEDEAEVARTEHDRQRGEEPGPLHDRLRSRRR